MPVEKKSSRQNNRDADIGPRTRRARATKPRKIPSALEISREKFVSNYAYLLTRGSKIEPGARKPPFVILGTADVGQVRYCDAKATYAQAGMEAAFGSRALGIIQRDDSPPDFVNPSPEVLGLEVLLPEQADSEVRQVQPGSADYEVAEAEIARGTWHIGYAAGFDGTVFGLPEGATVYLAGILDGAREDGTVLEVRRTSWDFEGIMSQGVNLEKETQANVYAVLLGMPRWECAFSCKDGIFRTQGPADRGRALKDIGHAARLRWGVETRRGVSPKMVWKCQSSRNQCDFLHRCNVTRVPSREIRPPKSAHSE